MRYCKYIGKNEYFELKNEEGKEAYTEIGAKAFLSAKEIIELKLPATIVKIEQWGFAHMKSLKTLHIPANEISLGKEVFLDCNNLKNIVIYPDNSGNEGLPLFMASVVTSLKRYDLFCPYKAADFNKHSEWMKAYDKALIDYIAADDENGFEPVLYGWFNDEGEDHQLENYKNERRDTKVRLCFLRLKFDDHLDYESREKLEIYLKDHVPGGIKEKEHTMTWSLMCSELRKDIENVKIMENIGAFTKNLRVELIDIINKSGDNPETAAYLLAGNNDADGTVAFDALSL